jgi:tRNA(Ile)-lysidine synthase
LLGARRAELRTHLRKIGAEWVEDPANSDPRFERVRVRQRLGELEQGGLNPIEIVRLASRLRTRCDELDRCAFELILRTTQIGLVTHITRAMWRAPSEVRRRALAVLIAAVSGSSRPPPWGDMDALEQRVMSSGYRGGTYGGVEFAPAEDGVMLLRDVGAVLGRAGAMPVPPLALAKNEPAIWDGRLAATALQSGWRIVPARNRERVAFENGLVRKTYKEVEETLLLRALVGDRVAHAFAPDINRAKP